MARPLTLLGLVPGVCVDLLVPGSVPIEPGLRLQVSLGEVRSEHRLGATVYHRHRGSRSTIISGLNQLKGCVRITNEEAALQFVRLRTSFETWHAWPEAPYEVEIITPDQVKHIPNFGLDREEGMRRVLEQHPTGAMGVLPTAELRSGRYKFGPARVSRVTDGFAVVRWIYWSKADWFHWKEDDLRGIQRVREVIGRDGSYRREVELELPSRELPKLWVPETFL